MEINFPQIKGVTDKSPSFLPLSSCLWALVIISFLTHKLRTFNFKSHKRDTRMPPTVPGSLPFVGHGLALWKQGIHFLINCYDNYGPIFKIKLFRLRVFVICNPSLASQFYKKSEEVFSMFKYIDQISLLDALLPDGKMNFIPDQLKASVGYNHRYFEQIENEARIFAKRMKILNNPDLVYECSRYVIRSSARVIGDMDIDDQVVCDFYKFCQLVSRIVVASIIIPGWILRPFYRKRLATLRKGLAGLIDAQIEEYRKDPRKGDSKFFRVAVDLCGAGTDKSLTEDDQISHFFTAMLFAAVGNTSLCLSNSIIDLLDHPEHGDALRVELFQQKNKNNQDISTLIANTYLQSCIMETVRTTSQLFTTGRIPVEEGITFDGYEIQSGEAVVLCPPLLQVYGSAQQVYSEPEMYNPTRFMDKTNYKIGENHRKEPQHPPYINAWGHALHACPGKKLALVELQTAMVMFLQQVKVKMTAKTRVEVDSFSPMSFVEKRLLDAEYVAVT